MNPEIIYFTEQTKPKAPEPWEAALAEAGFKLLRVDQPDRVLAYLRTYSIVALMIDVETESEPARELIEELNGREVKDPLAILGIVDDGDLAKEAAALAETGYTGLLTPETPIRFVVELLRVHQSALALAKFAESATEVGALAQQTRALVHDLSQPLAVVQGRLQLMAQRLPEGDPDSKTMAELVQMMLEATGYLRELQELHRKYS